MLNQLSFFFYQNFPSEGEIFFQIFIKVECNSFHAKPAELFFFFHQNFPSKDKIFFFKFPSKGEIFFPLKIYLMNCSLYEKFTVVFESLMVR